LGFGEKAEYLDDIQAGCLTHSDLCHTNSWSHWGCKTWI
jgi:uncharacterized protein YuzB (UPF0349 family)